MLNLAALLDDSAERHPERNAVVLGQTRLTYAAINAAACQVANLLTKRGIRPGDRIALCCNNTPDFAAVYYGILKTGAVVVPLNLLLRSREIAYHLTDSGAKAFICFEGTAELTLANEGSQAFSETPGCEHFFIITADPAAPSPIPNAETLDDAVRGQPTTFETTATEAGDTAVILYTSGTTGQPKGAELTHSNMVMNAIACHRLFGTAEHEVHLVALPLFHAFGQTVHLNAGFGAGATLVMLPRFEAATALGLMQREKVSIFAGVPTMYWGLLSADTRAFDLDAIAHNLRLALSGGAALPAEILEQVEKVFEIPIREGYGLSETSPLATFSAPDRPVRPGSIGQPIWGVQVAVVDEDWNQLPVGEIGEIAVRGHNVMKGYLNRPEATAEVLRDGWFRTGDLGRQDDENYVYIVGRAKDMIVRGGFNVYPSELESVMMTHPAVSLVAVVGTPHESHGEEIKAFVIRHTGSELTEAALIAWCKERIAGYKYPRIIEFRDSFPMTASGKILKRAL